MDRCYNLSFNKHLERHQKWPFENTQQKQVAPCFRAGECGDATKYGAVEKLFRFFTKEKPLLASNAAGLSSLYSLLPHDISAPAKPCLHFYTSINTYVHILLEAILKGFVAAAKECSSSSNKTDGC